MLRELASWSVAAIIITSGICYGYHLRPDALGVLVGLMMSFIFTVGVTAVAAIGRIE